MKHFFIILILSLYTSQLVNATPNATEKEIEQADEVMAIGEKLEGTPSEDLAREFIKKCYATRESDKNLFCLEYYVPFHLKFKITSDKILGSSFNKDELKIINERLRLQIEEHKHGNDPSSK